MSQIGTLSIGIIGDMAGLSKALDNAKKSVTDFATKTQALGKQVSDAGVQMTKWVTGPIVAAGAGILALTTKVANYADELLDLKAQTGLSTDSLQEWRHVAEIAGVSADTVANAVIGLTRRLPSLAEEGSVSSEQLAKLGLAFEDLAAMDPEDTIDTLIDRLSSMEDVTERNAIGAKLFGGAWIEMAPILDEGAEGIKALREEAHELGIVVSEESLDQIDAFRKEWVKVKEQFAGLFRELGMKLMPLMRDTFIPIIKNTIVPMLKTFAEKIAALVTWFGSLSPKTQETIVKLVALAAVAGPLVLTVGKLITAVGTLSKAFIAFATNPILLGLAGVAAVIVTLISRFNDAKQATLELEQSYVTAASNMIAASADLSEALDALAAGVGDLDWILSEADFSALISNLDALKESLTGVPADEIETRWADGVNRIFDALEAEYPNLQKILETYRRGFLEKGEEMADGLISGFREQASAFGDAVDATVAVGLGSAANATEGFSALGTEAGVAFGEGLSLGLNETAKTVDESFSAVGDNALLNLQTQGRMLSTEAERIAAETKARLDELMRQSAETMQQAAEGYTPAFADLQTQVNAAVWAFEMAKQTFGEQSLEAAAAFQTMLTVQERLKSVSDDLFTNLKQVNGPLLDLIVYMQEYTGELEANEQFMQAFIAHQAHAKDELAALGLTVEDMTGQWWEYAGITRTALETVEEETKKTTEATEDLGKGTDVVFGKWRPVPGIVGQVTTALSAMSESAKVTAEEFLTSVAGTMTSALTEFGEGIMTMADTNKQLAEDHKATLEQIDTDYQTAATSAADARDKDLQNLKDNLADGKITQETYTREMRQVWADYNTKFIQAEKDREGALDDEKTAYEEQKVTIGKLVGDLVHTVLTGIARTLLGYAAEHFALGLINAALLNFVQAGKEFAASGVAALAAAGMGIFESAIPFAQGGMVAGALGEPVPAIVHGGEMVLTPEQQRSGLIDYEMMSAAMADALEEVLPGKDRPLYLVTDGKVWARTMLPFFQGEEKRLGLVTP